MDASRPPPSSHDNMVRRFSPSFLHCLHCPEQSLAAMNRIPSSPASIVADGKRRAILRKIRQGQLRAIDHRTFRSPNRVPGRRGCPRDCLINGQCQRIGQCRMLTQEPVNIAIGGGRLALILGQNYSSRRTTMGSTRDARWAGIQHAASEIRVSSAATAAKVAGSVADTP